MKKSLVSGLWSLVLVLLCGCSTVKVSPEAEGRIAELLDDVIHAAVERGEVERGEVTPAPVVSNVPPPVVVVTPEPPKPEVPPEAVTTNEVLRSVRWDGFPKLRFDAPEIERWDKTGSKRVCAILRVNGKKVEWIAAGRGWTTVHNATVAGGKYGQDIPHGATVRVTFTDIYGKRETNAKELVWP